MLDEGDDVDDGSVGVRLGDFDFAGDIAGELFEEGVDFGGEEVGEHEGLADVFGAAIEAPVADAREVAPVGVLGDHVHVFKHRLNIVGKRSKISIRDTNKSIIQKGTIGASHYLQVVPVLHEHVVGLVNNDNLDRREEIEIPLLVAISSNDGLETKG